MDSDDEDGMASINGFCFCEKHGSELCHKCCCDYRIGNNFSIMKRLLNDFPDQSEDDFEGRPPLSNAYGLGAVLSKTRHPESPESLLYECKEHAEVNCNTCFDWGKLVVARIKFVAKNQGDIEIEASRDEKLGLLSAMGVGFSPSTRLPEAAVDRKLRSALDAAQTFTNVVEQTPFDPSTLPIWSSNQPKKIFAAIQRSSYAESMKVLSAKANGQTPFPLYQNAFMDLRQTLMTLANYCDTGRRTAILQDKNHEFAICVRIVNVFVIKDGVPVIVLLYGRGSRSTPLQATMDWIGGLMHSGDLMSQITATPQEQALLLTLLAMNSSRLSSEYQPNRTAPERTFKLSFLIPVGPLSQQDVGRLTSTSGCAVCGNRTTSKCSGCLSAEYCGAECQKADWKEHKPLCKSLKGGSWFPVTVSSEAEELRFAAARGLKLEMSNVNLMSTTESKPKWVDASTTTGTPPNMHGDKPFLIKIQLPTARNGGTMLIYDRQRSMHVYLYKEDDPAAYKKAEETMPTGYSGLKIYRWAKRVGDFQLSVCFDRAPAKDPQW